MADDVGYTEGAGRTIRADDEGDGKLIQRMIDHPANVAMSARATTVGASATIIPDGALARRKAITIYNTDANSTVYLGSSTVTVADGLPLGPGAYIQERLGPGLSLFGITEGDPIEVRSLEKA